MPDRSTTHKTTAALRRPARRPGDPRGTHGRRSRRAGRGPHDVHAELQAGRPPRVYPRCVSPAVDQPCRKAPDGPHGPVRAQRAGRGEHARRAQGDGAPTRCPRAAAVPWPGWSAMGDPVADRALRIGRLMDGIQPLLRGGPVSDHGHAWQAVAGEHAGETSRSSPDRCAPVPRWPGRACMGLQVIGRTL